MLSPRFTCDARGGLYLRGVAVRNSRRASWMRESSSPKLYFMAFVSFPVALAMTWASSKIASSIVGVTVSLPPSSRCSSASAMRGRES